MAYGFTRTLPAITGSHSDFPVLLAAGSMPVAATDGGINSIDNGGGNLRAYTDDTKVTQLPLEVVSFVTGGTPDVQVWVKTTAVTSATIYLEADSIATSQPAVTDTYGRNAVWTGRNVLHGLSTTDSSGASNTVSGTINTTSTALGTALRFNGTNNAIGMAAIGNTDNVYISMRAYFNDLASFNTIIDVNEALQFYFSDGNTLKVWDYSASTTITTTSSGFHDLRIVLNDTSNTMIVMLDGVEVYNGARVMNLSTGNDTNIGVSRTGTQYGEFDILQFNLFESANAAPSDFISTEYANQDDPANWGTSSAWVDSGGALSVLISSNLPALSSSLSFDQSAPVVSDAQISSELPSLISSLNIVKDDNLFDFNVISSLPSLSSALNLTSADNLYDVNVISALPTLTSILNASITTPSNDSGVISFLPELVSLLSVSIESPEIGVLVASELPRLSSSLSLTNITPEFSFITNSVLPSLSGVLSLYNGVLGISVGNRNNIDIMVKSRDIKTTVKSRSIKIITKSRNIKGE